MKATTDAPADTAEVLTVAAEKAGEQPRGDAQSYGSAEPVAAVSRIEVAPDRTGASLARSLRLWSRTVPAADMPCRTICFMRAARASDQPADGHAGPAGVQCCVLPEGPTLGSLQKASRL